VWPGRCASPHNRRNFSPPDKISFAAPRLRSTLFRVDTRFLLGPAGSGKTFRCLAEIRRELITRPDGPPLLLLAPKQATFQLERQLLAHPDLHGYTRLHILSFERLATFVLNNLGIVTKEMLSEEGRVMVLRALLLRHQSELKVFHASARLTGFAQQLSLLLRELQRHQLSAAKLVTLSQGDSTPAALRDKLHDLALLLRAYSDWLKTHALQDGANLLDVAGAALDQEGKLRPAAVFIQQMWLDGFAEMTPQEMELLAALVPHCGAVTLAFCLESEPRAQPSWLSTWSVVAQTFRRCHARLAALDDVHVTVETLSSVGGSGRFATSEPLRQLEANWSRPPTPAPLTVPDSPHLQLVICADAETEVICAAREILRHVRAGGRFRDCAVILRTLDTHQAALDRTFRRYDIPFFMDARESVAHHPLAELTRFALRTVTFNWRHDDWFGALKTGLAPGAETEIDWLENLALARGWEGNTWQEPISIPDNESLATRVEVLRQQLLPPFQALAKLTTAAVSGKTLSASLRQFWHRLKIETTLERWSSTPNPADRERHAQTHQTVLTQMVSWLDNLEFAFATESLPLRDWLPIVEAGLAGLTVGVVPPALDQVLIGAIDRSRNPEIKLACVLGLNEGVFPTPPSSSRLLTDADRTSLEKQDIYLGPTQRQRLGHERYLGYIAFTRASQRLIITRALRDAKDQPLNPSPFFEHLQRITGVTAQTFVRSENPWEAEHVSELAAPLLRELADSASASNELLNLPALQPLIHKWQQVQAVATSRLSPAVVEKLFSRELKSSVSRLEEFAACSFKFFAASGLRLQERKEFQFDDRDKGSFHHEVLEEFHQRVIASGRRWRDLSPTEAANLVATIARELLPRYENGKFLRNSAARFTGELLIARLQQLVSALIAWMPQYDFDPVACELAFNDAEGELPAWQLELANGHALKLVGRIDRVDLLRHSDGTALAVVMDYKSRARQLDPTKLYHGLELQLLSYLGVLNQLRDPEKIFGVKSLTPAGVFYVPLNGGAAKPSADRTEILALDDDARRAGYQHSGRFRADTLAHFDNRNAPKGDQFKFARLKSGDFAQRGNEALPVMEFAALRKKIAAHLRDYAQRIFAGDAAPSPYRIGPQTACDYCDFQPVCRFDPWTQPFRTLKKPSRDE
jgi:ATP-dependent helicase/nuclease subunit B